jgi:uncharacterized protein (UPF0332 family)
MDVLIELAVAICSGAAGILLFRFLKPKSNQQVIVQVEEKQKENDKLAEEISQVLKNAQEQMKEIEKEKNKDVTNQEVDDFYNNRKH